MNLKTGLFDIKSLNYVILTSIPKPLDKVYVFSTGGLCSVQFSSVTQSSLTLHNTITLAHQASLSITNSQSLLKLMSIESLMPSNHLILCHPLLLPSVFPSIKVFSNESVLHIRWPKYWSFSFSISPSNEYSGLISFRVDWLDLLAVQGTLKGLLQHHSSKVSILWCSTFFKSFRGAKLWWIMSHWQTQSHSSFLSLIHLYMVCIDGFWG